MFHYVIEDFNCKLSKETEVNLSKETEVFCTKDSLLNHEKSVHTENVPLLEDFKCNSCTKVFSTKDNLLNHMSNKSARMRVICQTVKFKGSQILDNSP